MSLPVAAGRALALPALAAFPAAALAAEGGRPFFEVRLPGVLRAAGPGGLLWWQWLALPVALAVAWGLGSLLGWATRRILGHLAAHTETQWDDELLLRLARPLTTMWAIGVAFVLEPGLAFGRAVDDRAEHLLRAAALFVLFWGLSRAAVVGFSAAHAAASSRQNAGLAGMLPLGQKIARVVLLALGVVALLNELGFQVTSVLAGLGIGGLAFAFGAQNTVQHLFGSIAIGVDQPFRVGDFVSIEGVTGTVESIGGRSTRVRTLDRTLVTFPNGKLAETRAETFSARDRIRLWTNLGLSYSTSEEQLRRVLAEVEGALRAHPKIWPDAVVVRFTDFKDSTLNVEVMAWFQTTDWNEFTAIRQELLLRFMGIVERAGTSFAFPTQTIHVVKD
ncbi:MAG TPA: mechanosensitive ion channel family protein [Anaeromyxobacteraceae bacterium]|nr:mechanosensitive ion channel family protein [Anaeromyxobacteraceae bacterium]